MCAVFTFIAIVYHCYMWSRLKNSVNEIKKVDSQPQSKIYEPIYVKPIVKSMKEYETQVLEMSVPIVDDSIMRNRLKRIQIVNVYSVEKIFTQRLRGKRQQNYNDILIAVVY
ncbi:unnamed protein product [Medioppia subpectinata]|uniref:Uncharacterized protein n=1 Tax=Medioppia subpectinata TaxID=1979941 RepID=A0A7R9Q0U8_9ACAR|nr:unnamed protein product [Medioppia subpectinata]CAG2108513.1 unnamed protein product [Medioppia subpectinata]